MKMCTIQKLDFTLNLINFLGPFIFTVVNIKKIPAIPTARARALSAIVIVFIKRILCVLYSTAIGGRMKVILSFQANSYYLSYYLSFIILIKTLPYPLSPLQVCLEVFAIYVRIIFFFISPKKKVHFFLSSSN